MIGIIDYGVGNLFSLSSSLAAIGAEATVTGDAELLSACDRIILPGVGAFEDAAKRLRSARLDELVKERAAAGTPVMGICLGMQLLFEESYEYGRHKGLGLLQGRIVPISSAVPSVTKIPHMGWNRLNKVRQHPLLKYTRDGEYVYFVHSYYAADCESSVIANTEYGAPLCAAAASGNVCGTQFHPEKSGAAGLAILKAFSEL